MNEDFLKALYTGEGFDKHVTYEKFKSDMLSMPAFRKQLHEDRIKASGVSFEQFEKDLAIQPPTLPPLQQYQKGPVGVARPGVMANPGQDDERLKSFYGKDETKSPAHKSALLAGNPKLGMSIDPVAQQELGVAVAQVGSAEKEAKSATLVNMEGDVLTNAKSFYGDNLEKKKENYSKNPQIADAEFSLEALNIYEEEAKYLAKRSRERLKALNADKYSPAQIDKAVNTYTALSLMGQTEEAQAFITKFPELKDDPNLNNIFGVNDKLRELSLARMHVAKNNPEWVKYNTEKIPAKQKEINQNVEKFREENKDIPLWGQGIPMLVHPNVGQTIKGRIGGWAKNLAEFVPFAETGAVRDWGREMMDMNPKSSDYQGKAIEEYKKVQGYDVVFDGDKISYVRDPKTGFIVEPTPEKMKTIKEEAKGKESQKRFNAKPFVGQTADVLLDMAPIVALTYATGGTLSGLLGSATARGIGVVAGSALQVRGDLMDQMLLHPDISPTEAEVYTDAIGFGIGLLSLINPMEAPGLAKALPGILKKNSARLLNKEITKGQFAWEVTKDLGSLSVKETSEELLQEWFQYGAQKGIDATQPGYGRFDIQAPTGDDMLEIGLVSSAVAMLGGAGSIRASRNAMIDEALSTALDKPKMVSEYLGGMEDRANAITDEAAKEQALDHIERIRERWANIQTNVDSVKGLDKNKRGKLAGLIADSNALESEASGITNSTLLAAKKEEIKAINDEIKALITPGPAAAPTTAVATTPGELVLGELEDENLTEEDKIRMAAASASRLSGKDSEVEIENFEKGQVIEDERGTGKVVEAHKNADGSVHAIDVEYEDGDTKRVNVFRKTPMEAGVKIVGTKPTATKAPAVDALKDVESTKEAFKGIEAEDLKPLVELAGGKVGPAGIATAYHAAKADNSNPELVAAVEKLLGTKVAPKPAPPPTPKTDQTIPEGYVSYEEARKIVPTSKFKDIPEGEDEGSMEARSRALREQENTPPTFQKHPVGTRAVDKRGEVYELRDLPFDELVVNDDGGLTQPTVDKYAKWLQEGNEMPPITGVENFVAYGGKVKVSDGRHRIAAAKKAGLKTVPVWVNLTDPVTQTRPVMIEDDIKQRKSKSTTTASIPVMITKKMEADLRGRGYTQPQIDKLTPQEANDILSKPAEAKEDKSKQYPAEKDKSTKLQTDEDNKAPASSGIISLIKKIFGEPKDRPSKQRKGVVYKTTIQSKTSSDGEVVTTKYVVNVYEDGVLNESESASPSASWIDAADFTEKIEPFIEKDPKLGYGQVNSWNTWQELLLEGNPPKKIAFLESREPTDKNTNKRRWLEVRVRYEDGQIGEFDFQLKTNTDEDNKGQDPKAGQEDNAKGDAKRKKAHGPRPKVIRRRQNAKQRAEARSKKYHEALSTYVGKDAEGIVMQYLLENSIHSGVIRDLYGVKLNNKNGTKIDGEVQSRLSLIDNKTSKSETLDKIAEEIWELIPEELNVPLDKIKKALEDIIQSYNSREKMSEDIIKRFVAPTMNAEEKWYIEKHPDAYANFYALSFLDQLTDEEIQALADEEYDFENSPEYQEMFLGPEEELEVEEDVDEDEDIPPRGKYSSDTDGGDRLSDFKKGDIVYRNYDGRYEEYEVVDDRKDLWKLKDTTSGFISTWNAVNNDGFFDLSKDAEVEADTDITVDENVGNGMSLSNFDEGDTIWRKVDGIYQEFEVMKNNDEKPWILKSPDGVMHRVSPYSEGFNTKTAQTDTSNSKFTVDDTVVFTSKNGEELEASFRGYVGEDQAVIVIKGGNQMQVPVGQLKAYVKPKAAPKPKPAPTKSHRETITDKFREVFEGKGIPPEQVDAAIALMNARANSWASEVPGRNADEWFDRIADVKAGEFKIEEPKETIFDQIRNELQNVSKKDNLQDVGEKIGGAKKDLWTSWDNVKMDDIEGQPLSKSFPEPDFKKLVASNVLSQEGAILIKFLRDSIPTKPRTYYMVGPWAQKVESVIDFAKQILELEANQEKQLTNRFIESIPGIKHLGTDYHIFSEIMKELGFPNNVLKIGDYKIKEMQVIWKTDPETKAWTKYEGPFYVIYNNNTKVGEEFRSLDEAIKNLKVALAFTENTKGNKPTEFFVYPSQKTDKGSYFIGKKGATGVVRIMDGFEKVGEAHSFVKEKHAELQAIWDAMKEPVEERRDTNRGRKGPDWRKGKNITAKDFSEQFGFRGVEFGNWVNTTERQQSVNEAYDALMDMASALGITPKAISLNGELGFAFGARGSGKASAHYEPGKVVINLTKKKGAGSLAHEWWHALDNYFSRLDKEKTGFLTQSITSSPNHYIRLQMRDAFLTIRNVIKNSKLPARSKVLDQTRTQPYWSTIIEMTARSFENYIISKLAETNQQNDYLANFKETGEWITGAKGGIDALKNYPYPLVEESPAINEAYQQFFEAINEDENAKLYQDDKGAVETLEDGRKVILALNNPDFSTMVHELAHVFGDDLTEQEVDTVNEFGGWEAWARGFERYLIDGHAPTVELRDLFNKFKQWLTDIYKYIAGSPIEKKVSPAVKKIFDRLLTEQKGPTKFTFDKEGNIQAATIIKQGETTAQVEYENGNRSIRTNTELFETKEEAQARFDEIKTPASIIKFSKELGVPEQEAEILASLKLAKNLTPIEKAILYRQYKRGVMDPVDIEKYTSIRIDESGEVILDKWAKVILHKSNRGNIDVESIEFEETTTPKPTPAKSAKRKIRDEKQQDKIKGLWEDFIKGDDILTTGGLDPKRIEAGTKLVAAYIEQGVYKFADIIEDAYAMMGDKLAPYFEAIKYVYSGFLNTRATEEQAAQMDESLRKFTYESLTSKFNEDVSDQSGDSTGDSQGRPDRTTRGEGDIRGQDRGRGRDAGTEDQGQDNGQDGEQQGSEGPGRLLTPPLGEQTDLFLHPEDQPTIPEKNSTGDVDGRGNSTVGTKGSNVDDDRGASIDPGTKAATESFQQRKQRVLKEQRKAEPIPIVIGDMANIEATLPMLLAPQQEDVFKAEERFFNPRHQNQRQAYGKGIMFTNGTGSGKTYVGLGIIKRFVKQGKENILILTPSQAKVNDWKNDAEDLLLDVTPLKDTKTAGKGIVATTFANFRINKELLKRDFDLIVYDESHKIMEASGGKESNATEIHRMMGNKDEAQALYRIQLTHPLWKKAAEIISKISAIQNNPDLSYRQKTELISPLHDELEPIRDAQHKLLPAMKARANEAVKNTKVVFLSATPYKEVKNLKYANGFLFDWGDEVTVNNNGSRVDAMSRYFLENFGSVFHWFKHKLTARDNPNADAIAMQEIDWSEKQRELGLMSGSPINSDMDYSREFPLVTGFNADLFNQAFSDIFNYDNGKFQLLTDAARTIFYNYNYTVPLFEALKISQSIDRIQKHIKLGRKVVVFHRRRMGDVTPPFQSVVDVAITEAGLVLADPLSSDRDREKANLRIDQAEAFKAKYASLFEYEKTLDYRPVIDQLTDAFPGRVGFLNGSESPKKKGQAIKDFNTDGSHIDILVAQEEAGKEGISLHDTTGKHPRVLMSMSLPTSTTTTLQAEGRVYRLGQSTNAMIEYPLLGFDLEIAHFGQKLNKRLSTTENMAMGNQARDLIRSFAEGVLFHSTTDDPNLEQGKGGKEYDRRIAQETSDFRKARNIYDSNQKVTGKRDDREGVDYFATPEPLGQKMVEWADIRAGEDAMEPSAGHGAIAMWFKTHTAATSIEPSYALFSKLGSRAGGGTRKVLNQNFEDHNIVNKYDAIVMNPPFGTAGKTAMDHIDKAFKHLREGGRLVALIPVGQMDKRIDAFLYGEDGRGRLNNPDAHLVKEILLPSVTFKQAGTSVNTRVIIIDKVSPRNNPPSNRGSVDLRNANNIDELFDRLEFLEMPERTAPANPNPYSNPSDFTNTQGESMTPPKPSGGIMGPVTEFRHTKTNALLYSIKMTQRVPTDVYYQYANKAKTMNGEYSRFTKTFLFTDKASAERFREEVNSPAQFSMDPLLAPNGKPSRLTPEQYAQVRTPEFKAWFGDWEGDPAGSSKVVDENGEPMVVYHGSDNLNTFTEFEKGDIGFHFGQTTKQAEDRLSRDNNTRANELGLSEKERPDGIGSFFLKIINPVVLPDIETWTSSSLLKTFREAEPSVTWNSSQSVPENIKRILGEIGDNIPLPDGIKYHNQYEGNKTAPDNKAFIAFSPTQIKSATDNTGAFDPANNDIRFSMDSAPSVMPDLVNGFYSPLEKIIRESKADKLPVKQWIEKFAKGEEAKWTGLTDWLSNQEGSVTKSDILDFLEDNRVEIKEVVYGGDTEAEGKSREEKMEDIQTELRSLGYEMERDMAGDIYLTVKGEDEPISEDEDIAALPERVRMLGMDYAALHDEIDDFDNPSDTKYGGYTLPGEKTNYKEVLVTMPPKTYKDSYSVKQVGATGTWEVISEMSGNSVGYPMSFEEAESDAALRNKREQSVPKRTESPKFKSNHWSEPNILVHLRMDTRIDANGDKVLFLEEVQSDWAQKGRKEGFLTPEREAADKRIAALNDAQTNAEVKLRALMYRRRQEFGANTSIQDRIDAGDEDIISAYDAEQRIQKERLVAIDGIRGNTWVVAKPTPIAPFVTDTSAWTKLALKVATKEAVKQGATKIAWTTGDQQNERYAEALVKVIDEIKWSRQVSTGNKIVTIQPIGRDYIKFAVDKDTGKIINDLANASEYVGQSLDDLVGKSIAEKIIDDVLPSGELSGNGLKIKSKGMPAFYGDPEKDKLGIVGSVAKSMFGDVGTIQLQTTSTPNDTQNQVLNFRDWVWTNKDDNYTYDDAKNDIENNSPVFKEYKKAIDDKSILQHSVTITPELANQVKAQGLPLFSIQAAETAIKSGNPDPNAQLIIKLKDAGATVEENLRQFADLWIDLVEKQSKPFINRGLELIKGTEYDTGDPRKDLANAIAEKAAKSKKDNKLINWVKDFWKRVGKIMKINVTPEQLQDMTVGEYLDIAATQMIYGNEVYMELLADEAKAKTDNEPVITPAAPPDNVAKYESLSDDEVASRPVSSGKPVPPKPLSNYERYLFEGRDEDAQGVVIANPKGPTMERMLQGYAGPHRRVLETLVLLFPTLKTAGITITVHESKDSYANAVVANGGTASQAVKSGGFYHNKEVHINLAKADLKENTALHEAFHPIIRELLVKNKPAFKRFMAEILADPEMRRRYLDEFSQNYQYLAGQENAIEEEMLVEASADIVMKRVLRSLNDMPDKLFDRILKYIKDVLGDAYGKLADFISDKESFAVFANGLAEAISKGMVVPMNPEINDNIRTIVNESIQHSKQRAGNLFGGQEQTDLFGLMNNQRTLNQEKATPEALLRQKYFDLGYPAPNGQKSNLTPDQYYQVRTPEFKAWFGDWEGDPAGASKVVDENGEPLVVYHGTAQYGFQEFKGNKPIFFSDSKGTADSYQDKADGQSKGTYGVFLNSRNIEKIDANGSDFASIVVEEDTMTAKKTRLSVSGIYESVFGFRFPSIVTEKQGAGKTDGVVVTNVKDDLLGSTGKSPSNVYVVVAPTQIKSATDNTGAFDVNNPDIRFSMDPYDPVTSPEFKTWFGGSKVVDENGAPLVVYHGSTNFEPITKFRKGAHGLLGPGTYFTNDERYATDYADKRGAGNGQVIDAYLHMQNPYIVIGPDGSVDLLKKLYGEAVAKNRQSKQGNINYLVTARDTKKIRDLGHDGIIYKIKDIPDAYTEYVVFEPTQVKSASKNTGQFSARNPDIRFSMEPDTVKDDTGKPIVFYHGTGAEFSDFDSSKQNSVTGHGDFGKGFYLSASPGVGRYYSLKFEEGRRVVKEFNVIAKKPFEINISDEVFDEDTKKRFLGLRYIKDYERDIIKDATKGELPFAYKKISKEIGDRRLSDIFQENGFDAVYVNRTLGNETTEKAEVVVFDKTQIKTPFQPPQFSSHSEAKVARIKKDLAHDILTQPDYNFEPIVEMLIRKGTLTKADGDELLGTKRAAEKMGFSGDKLLGMLIDMAGLRHLHRMDVEDNLQVKNANMQQLMNDMRDVKDEGLLDGLLDKYSPGTIKEWIEEVMASGLAHPAEIIAKYRRANKAGDPVGVMTIIATSIAFAELKREATFYKNLVDQTGDIEASTQLQYVRAAQYELANLAKTNGSHAGAALGIRSKLLQLAGLTYESEMAQIEEINESKAGKGIEIDQATKDEVKRLVDLINTQQEQMDKLIAQSDASNSKKVAAEKEYNRKAQSALEARPIMTKAEALEHLRRLRGIRASFSLMLSADAPEFNVLDIINELVKIAHQEITEEGGRAGFKNVVARVQSYDPTITEEQVYEALVSTTAFAKQKALSEYAKRQAETRKQVKDIAKVEKIVTDQVLDLLRNKKVPTESKMAEFGDLLQSIEKGIYMYKSNAELYVKWLNDVQLIREKYALAFLHPNDPVNNPPKDDDQILGELINAVLTLKDNKLYDWMRAQEAELLRQKEMIDSGRISELIAEEDRDHIELPGEFSKITYEDGVATGTEPTTFDFGQMDRQIRENKKELEKVKSKFRKKGTLEQYTYWLYRLPRGTLGTAQAMIDLSMIAIQGFKASLVAMVRQPGALKQAFTSSLKTFYDEMKKDPGLSNEIHYNMTQNKYYNILQAAGLDLTSPDSHHFINEMVSQDDAFDLLHDKTKGRKNIAAKVARGALGIRRKLKNASNASFATYLNILSFEAAVSYIEKVKAVNDGKMPSVRELAVKAHEINSSTGRTKRAPGATEGAAYFFWAPKLYLSQILNVANIVADPVNFAGNMTKLQIAIAKGDEAAIQKHREMVRVYGHRAVNSLIFATSSVGLYMIRVMLAKWQCGENASVNTNIAKPSFLKINCGELTLDPTGNHRQWLALGARAWAGFRGDPYLDYMGRPVTTTEQIMDLMQYKFNPLVSTGFQMWDGTDFLGRRRQPDDQSFLMWQSRAEVLLDHLKPIGVGNVVEIAGAKGMDGKLPTIISKPMVMIEAIQGFGVTSIDEEEENARKAIEKEVRDKKKAAKQTEDVGQLRTRIGNLKELQGSFIYDIPAEALDLTPHTVSFDGKTYKVFKRNDDPVGNKKDDDLYTVKTTQSGPNKGKKYFERIPKDKKINYN